MSAAKKKTRAAKSTARKAPARTAAAEKKTASKPKATKAKAKAKTVKTKAAKAKTTKSKATKPKATKPKATKAKTTKASEAPQAAAATEAPTPAPAPASKTAAPRKRTRSRANRTKQVHAPASEVLPQRTLVTATPPSSRLGNKWECFSCGAKFYDLNKPEPLCPKCGANQLERPKATREVKPRTAPRASRAMAPLLDEDEDAMVVKKEELDLGVADIDEAVSKFIDADDLEEDAIEEEDDEI